MTAKQAMFFALFSQGEVSVFFDGRRAGVVVPPPLHESPIVCLTYGPSLPIPIPDLIVDESGIRATLSFARTPRPTFVPWEAVFGLGGAHGAIEFPGEVPPEVIAMRLAQAGAVAAGPAKPRFSLVAPEEGAAELVADAPRVAPALRVVKEDVDG